MSRNYKLRDQRKLYFVSFATVNWIDVLYNDLLQLKAEGISATSCKLAAGWGLKWDDDQD